QPVEQEEAIALSRGGALRLHPNFPQDREPVLALLEQLGHLDLREPFVRVRDALSEARKMGVTARSTTAAA
ncbi:MAG: hypothetical protein SNJ75_18360, partial [Gemmataceae bacterium]